MTSLPLQNIGELYNFKRPLKLSAFTAVSSTYLFVNLLTAQMSAAYNNISNALLINNS